MELFAFVVLNVVIGLALVIEWSCCVSGSSSSMLFLRSAISNMVLSCVGFCRFVSSMLLLEGLVVRLLF